MSVSDRLRELDERATPGRWGRGGNVITDEFDVVAMTNPTTMRYVVARVMGQRAADATLIATLRNALPELVAVVRAAERYRKIGLNDPTSLDRPTAGSDLDRALAALDAELSKHKSPSGVEGEA